jgi:hypothetical protein
MGLKSGCGSAGEGNKNRPRMERIRSSGWSANRRLSRNGHLGNHEPRSPKPRRKAISVHSLASLSRRRCGLEVRNSGNSRLCDLGDNVLYHSLANIPRAVSNLSSHPRKSRSKAARGPVSASDFSLSHHRSEDYLQMLCFNAFLNQGTLHSGANSCFHILSVRREFNQP